MNTIIEQSSTSNTEIDRYIENQLGSSILNDDIEPVRELSMKLLLLFLWVFSIKLDVMVRSTQLLGQFHLDTLVLGETQPSRPGANL